MKKKGSTIKNETKEELILGWKVPGLITPAGISVETYSLVIENHESHCVGGGSTSQKEVTVTLFYDLLARSGIRSNRE